MRVASVRWTFHVWHLVVAVLITALIFGAFRFLDASSEARGLVAAFVGLMVMMVPFVTGIHLGAKLGRRASRYFAERGKLRGGGVGFLMGLSGRLIHSMTFVAGMLLGLVFLLLTAVALASLAGLISFGWGRMTIWPGLLIL